MRFVVDCSVAVKWVVSEAGSELAAGLFYHELFAPDCLYLECANVLWKYVRRDEAIGEQVAYKLLALRRMRLQTSPMEWLLSRALEIACSLQHPVYDCLYLGCAEACKGPVTTADKRLLGRAASSPFSHLVVSLEDAAAN